MKHRDALKERWRRRYGAPIGAWVMEFQPRRRRPEEERRAPHIHLYLGLPDEVSDNEYQSLRRRTLERRRLEKKYGRYGGRNRGKRVKGEFSDWLLKSWWEIVGSGEPAHRRRGVDLTVAFFSEKAQAGANRALIADYFWRESGKRGQKTPPEGFGGLKLYGRWGSKQGFAPVESRKHVDMRGYTSNCAGSTVDTWKDECVNRPCGRASPIGGTSGRGGWTG